MRYSFLLFLFIYSVAFSQKTAYPKRLTFKVNFPADSLSMGDIDFTN